MAAAITAAEIDTEREPPESISEETGLATRNDPRLNGSAALRALADAGTRAVEAVGTKHESDAEALRARGGGRDTRTVETARTCGEPVRRATCAACSPSRVGALHQLNHMSQGESNEISR